MPPLSLSRPVHVGGGARCARAPRPRMGQRRPPRVATAYGGCPLGFGDALVPEPVSKVADAVLLPPNLATLPRPTGERWLPVVGETLAHATNHLEWAHKR